MSLLPAIGSLIQPSLNTASPSGRTETHRVGTSSDVARVDAVAQTNPTSLASLPKAELSTMPTLEPAQSSVTLSSPAVLSATDAPVEKVTASETTRAMLPELWPDANHAQVKGGMDRHPDLMRVVDGMSDIYQTVSIDAPDEFAVPWIDNLPDKV